MTAIAGSSVFASLVRLICARATWIAVADVAAILLALSLPWSTSLVAVFAVVMLIAMVPFLDVAALLRSLRQPVSVVPIALFVARCRRHAVVGRRHGASGSTRSVRR